MKKYYRLPVLLISLLVLAFSAACGTLEVGIERSATPQQAAVATDQAHTPTPAPQATATPVEIQATARLCLAATALAFGLLANAVFLGPRLSSHEPL